MNTYNNLQLPHGLALSLREIKESDPKNKELEESDVKPPRFKYQEDKILDEIEKYIESTYGQHYASSVKSIQTFDAINEIDGSEAWRFYRNCALKYLWRFGKKQGFNKMDLLKAIHYLVLVYYMKIWNDEKAEKAL